MVTRALCRASILLWTKRSRTPYLCFGSTSPLKLIERRFGLKPLASRDAEANDMHDCFDFDQAPAKPFTITHATRLDFSDLQPTRP